MKVSTGYDMAHFIYHRPNRFMSMDSCLMIDDNGTDMFIAQKMPNLICPQLSCAFAWDGIKGIHYLKEHLDTRDPPIFILLDLVMHLSDGYGFI